MFWLYGENSKEVVSAENGTIKKEDFLKTKRNELKKEAKEVPLKGVIEDGSRQAPETIDNPKRKELVLKIKNLRVQCAVLTSRLKELQSNKKQLEEGQNPILLTATTGALLGTFWKKFRKQEMDVWSSLGFACLGGLAGSGIGLMIKKQRADELELITKKSIPSAEFQIKRLVQKIQMYLVELKQIPKVVRNPDYQEPIVEQERSVTFEEIPEVIEDFKSGGRIICSEDMRKMNFRSLDFKGNWLNLLGQPAVNFKMAVFGKPGQGKSTFCVQLAHYLATNFGRVLYVSGEEGFSKTLKDKLSRNNAFHKNLRLADFSSGEELLQETPPNAFHFVIIDSLNNMEIDVQQLSEIENMFNRSAVITISQTTKDGKFRGSQEVLHNADITLKVEQGLAECLKNRFNSIGFQFTVLQEFNA